MCTKEISITNFITRFALIGLTTLVTAPPVFADAQYAVSGNAYNIENNQLLYRELYTPINDAKEVTVSYVKPDGTEFASKVLKYSGAATQPEFDYNDQRDKEHLGARFEAGRVVLTYDQEGYRQEKEIMETLGLVIDAGFDAFIQQEWAALVAGKKPKFNFTLPYRLSTIKLRAKQITAHKSPLFSASAPASWRYFMIEPANKFTAFFADPIYLAYESDGKYLMRYYGRSNLDNDQGGTWDVRIEYEYW